MDRRRRGADLPYARWRETAATLQLWTRIVGQVRLALTPWLNHGWQVPLRHHSTLDDNLIRQLGLPPSRFTGA